MACRSGDRRGESKPAERCGVSLMMRFNRTAAWVLGATIALGAIFSGVARADGPWLGQKRRQTVLGVTPPPTGCPALYPSSYYSGWYGLPAYAAFPGAPSPSYMGSLGYHHAPGWYRPNGKRIGLFQYVFEGYSGVFVPW